VLSGDTLWHLQKFFQYIKHIILEFTPLPTALLYPPSFIPGIVSTGIIFELTYICAHFLHHIHPPTPFPPTSSLLPLAPNTLLPGNTCSTPPVLWFCRRKKRKDKEKNMTFLLVWDKGSYTGSFLVIFPWYMYYNPNSLISSNFIHSTLVPFLWQFQPAWDFYTHSCIESISTIFKPLLSFFYPTPSICDLLFVWPVFHDSVVFVLGLYEKIR
jgi:hypothetical protein